MTGEMEALVLIRGPLLPEVPVRAGTFLHGRVVDPQTLLLEGVRLQAKLPPGAVPGTVLRLLVEETSAERLHLRVIERPAEPAAQQAPQAPPTPVAVPLPGGAAITVLPDGGAQRPGSDRRAGAVTVRFDAPTLGRLDVRLDGHAAAIHVSAGEPAQVVRAAAPELGRALAVATGRPVPVTVHPRARTLDASA